MHQIPDHEYELQQDHRVVRLLVQVIILALCCQKYAAFVSHQLLQEQSLISICSFLGVWSLTDFTTI